MKRTYLVQGRNGHFAVDQHNDQNSGVTDMITGVTRAVATRVAAALNAAYTDGRTDQATDSRDLVEQAYARGREAGIQAESVRLETTGSVSRETLTEAFTEGQRDQADQLDQAYRKGWREAAESVHCPDCQTSHL
jgi:hypothetical protein